MPLSLVEPSGADGRKPGRLMSVNEARGYIGLSVIGRTALYDLLMSGEIPSVTIGSRRAIPVEALDAWLDRLTATAEK